MVEAAETLRVKASLLSAPSIRYRLILCLHHNASPKTLLESRPKVYQTKYLLINGNVWVGSAKACLCSALRDALPAIERGLVGIPLPEAGT
jgi:hypothetical protein